jgi:hypothetical protein
MLMPPLVQKIEPGDVIGRCRTVRELGRGGVGTVYLATHQTLQIEVALKILSPALSIENPALAERFIREAQLAARIRHPNVIAVMDAAHDEATGLYYIVMEYVGGGSLSWHLRNGPMPEAKALAIVTGIAHALVIAEENRIVHRDIKPDNIMLDLRGTSKLADLGLAKHSLDSHVSLTLGGSFMGTPAYMSPEQARDAKIADTRDDIYSLGASFYECLTGEAPFQGETPYNIMSELLTKPSPKPSALRPNLSRSSDLICRKMMAKTRDLRYHSARSLLQDLQHAQTYGDSGIDRLEAASFDQDWIAARQEEENFGVETSSEGVYAEPETRVPPGITLRSKATHGKLPPARANNDVFGAAMLLIALVLVTTLLLAWANPKYPASYLKNEFAQISNQLWPPAPLPPPPTPTVKPVKAKEKDHVHVVNEKEKPPEPVKISEQESHPTVIPNPPTIVTPPAPTNSVATAVQPEAAPSPPIVYPENAASETNTNNALIVPPAPTESQATSTDGAFAARDIAEKSLPPSDITPTGKAELLRIIGERTPGQTTPATWRYYFFEKSASGNARIVTVHGGNVIKNGEDLGDFATPYQEQHVLSEDKLILDSNQALHTAEGYLPGVSVSSAEFMLMQQKNSVPMWKITLWTRDIDGEEHRVGEVTLLAENGTLISKNLKEPASQP